MPKQATVRVPDPSLLAACSELLERQIGRKLSQSTVISAALVALKNQHTHLLLTEQDCHIRALRTAVISGAEIINTLIDAGYCQAGEYEVRPHPEQGIELLLDGEPVKPTKAPSPPAWESERKKQALN